LTDRHLDHEANAVNVELVERRKVRVDDAAIIWQRIVIVGNIRVEHMLLLCIQPVESGECLIVDVCNPKRDGISAAKRLGAAGGGRCAYTSVLHNYDREMTGKLDSKIIHMIPMYKSKWRENVVPLCIYSYVQLLVIEG
jgi:hypothetical protein